MEKYLISEAFERLDKFGKYKEDFKLPPIRNKKRVNIHKVLSLMKYNNPTFIDPVKGGYKLKWGSHPFRFYEKDAEKEIEKIKKVTGIDVGLTRGGYLFVPEYEGDTIPPAEEFDPDRPVVADWSDEAGDDFDDWE